MDNVWLQKYVYHIIPRTFNEDELSNVCIKIADEFNAAFNRKDSEYISRYEKNQKVLYLPIGFQFAFTFKDDYRTIHVEICENSKTKDEYDINFHGLQYIVHKDKYTNTKGTLQEIIEHIIMRNLKES